MLQSGGLMDGATVAELARLACEREILRAAADGSTNAELAAALHLSQGTVRNYLSTAIQELAVRNRAEAVRIARGKEWL
jgi:two-component system, NarL family, response regulator DesR